MKYIITVEEETFEIEMGRGELVWINHHPYTVDLQDVDGRPEYSLLVDHRSYEAHVEEVEGGECQMMVAGRPYRAHLQHGSAALPCILEGDAALPCVLEGDAALPCVLEGDAALPCVLEGGHCLRKPTVRPEPCGVEEVCAPLPGLLVATTVEVEQRVESGEVVAVLESMKMNLELRAPRGGIVQALHGTPGLEVGQGEALVVIGPDE